MALPTQVLPIKVFAILAWRWAHDELLKALGGSGFELAAAAMFVDARTLSADGAERRLCIEIVLPSGGAVPFHALGVWVAAGLSGFAVEDGSALLVARLPQHGIFVDASFQATRLHSVGSVADGVGGNGTKRKGDAAK